MALNIVAFSGGLDSTYLLYDLLNTGFHADLVTGRFTEGDTKQGDRQEKAIASIIAEIKQMVDEGELPRGVDTVTEFPVPGTHCGRMSLGQNTSWLLVLLHALKIDTKAVHLGYVLGDSCALTVQDMQSVWVYMLQTAAVQPDCDGELPVLKFPLLASKKSFIISRIPDRLARHVTWCENRDDEDDCGLCPSCRTMESAMADFDIYYTGQLAPKSLVARVKKMRRKRIKHRTALLKENNATPSSEEIPQSSLSSREQDRTPRLETTDTTP